MIAGVIALRIVTIDRLLPSSGITSFALRYAIVYVPALLLMVLANVGFTLIYFAARRLENPMASSATTYDRELTANINTNGWNRFDFLLQPFFLEILSKVLLGCRYRVILVHKCR